MRLADIASDASEDASDGSGEDSDAEGSPVLAATAPDYVLSPGVRAAAMAVSAEIDVQDN